MAFGLALGTIVLATGLEPLPATGALGDLSEEAVRVPEAPLVDSFC